MTGFFKRIEIAKAAFNAHQQHRENADIFCDAIAEITDIRWRGINEDSLKKIAAIEEKIAAIPMIGEDYQKTKRTYLGHVDYIGCREHEADFLSWMMLKYRGVADNALPAVESAVGVLLGKGAKFLP